MVSRPIIFSVCVFRGGSRRSGRPRLEREGQGQGCSRGRRGTDIESGGLSSRGKRKKRVDVLHLDDQPDPGSI